MTRTSQDQYQNDRLFNGYDYKNQAWVLKGVYQACNHPNSMNCRCYGKVHGGEPTRTGKLDGSNQ